MLFKATMSSGLQGWPVTSAPLSSRQFNGTDDHNGFSMVVLRELDTVLPFTSVNMAHQLYASKCSSGFHIFGPIEHVHIICVAVPADSLHT